VRLTLRKHGQTAGGETARVGGELTLATATFDQSTTFDPSATFDGRAVGGGGRRVGGRGKAVVELSRVSRVELGISGQIHAGPAPCSLLLLYYSQA